MNDYTHGIAPGIDTPIEKAAGVSQDSKRLRTDTSNATKIIAVYARIQAQCAGFTIDRGIGLDSIVALLSLAIFAAARGLS